MPIPGEEWGKINKFEKPYVGLRDIDLRETTPLDAISHAADEVFSPTVDVQSDLYAIILRKEPDIVSSGKKLSRFRCYIMSGFNAEVPFSLQSLGYPNNSTSKKNRPIDSLTSEMFPIFTCDSESLSNSLSNAKEGTIVKVDFENRDNLAGPRILSTTSFAPVVSEKVTETISLYKKNFDKKLSISQQVSSTINTEETQRRLRKKSLSKTNNQSLRLLWPVPNSKPSDNPKSRFGDRQLDSGTIKSHRGVDIGGELGDDVLSSENGVVHSVRYFKGGYGTHIVIEHNLIGKKIYTLYAHLSETLVSVGQSVSKGQRIGRVGSTGNSKNPHLHYEVRVDGNNRPSSVEPYVHIENLPKDVNGREVIQ